MLRVLAWGLAVCGLLSLSSPVFAQWYQQRSQAAPAPTSRVNPIFVPQSPNNVRRSAPQITISRRLNPAPQPAAAPPPAAAQPTVEPQHHHSGHHHQGPAPNWVFWGGYPVWSGAYRVPIAPAYSVPFFNDPQLMAVPPIVDVPVPAPAANNQGPAEPRGKPHATNAEQKAKAGKFLGFGDTNFANQKYGPAIDRYKLAAQVAPDLPDTYLRQGHALVALGQYDSAVKAFKRGLRIRADWNDSPFRLDQLYGPDQIAKTSHIETLAKAVEGNPLDSTLLWALGMQLYFDGQ
ncbi:MAG TPA: tetratricopeptide repeat protein, partial [Pirellulales bacterium]